jgi:hypothetical protein
MSSRVVSDFFIDGRSTAMRSHVMYLAVLLRTANGHQTQHHLGVAKVTLPTHLIYPFHGLYPMRW